MSKTEDGNVTDVAIHSSEHFKVMLSLFLVFTFSCGIDAPDYDMPSKDDLGNEGLRKWLHELCLKYVETYLMTGSEVEPLVQQVHELDSAMGANGFLCRIEQCDKTYVNFIPTESSKYKIDRGL